MIGAKSAAATEFATPGVPGNAVAGNVNFTPFVNCHPPDHDGRRAAVAESAIFLVRVFRRQVIPDFIADDGRLAGEDQSGEIKKNNNEKAIYHQGGVGYSSGKK